jgi:hypothetical protein
MLIFFYIDDSYTRDSERYYPLKILEIILTLVAMWGMYTHILKAEIRELRLINKSHHQHNLGIMPTDDRRSMKSESTDYIPFN